MLLDPENQKPLIDWSIELALESGLKPIVITRKSKTTLTSYLGVNWGRSGLEIFSIEASKEWPDSILQCEDLWGDINVLLLPDTRFAPRNILRRLVRDCEQGRDSSFAYFHTEESLESWGVLGWGENQKLQICEKPRYLLKKEKIAPWGLIAFRREIGRTLFSKLLSSNQTHGWFECKESYALHRLDCFRDITRKASDLELVSFYPPAQ